MEHLSQLAELKNYLAGIAPGPVTKTSEVEKRLALCWGGLDGNSQGGMEARKLIDRLKSVEWNCPKITFQIERHGAFVMGSVYAEVQSWVVDVESAVATLKDQKKRLKGRRRAALNTAPIVKEIADLIIGGKTDARLKWKNANEVKVLVGTIIPDNCPQQTLAGRRRRFWTDLERLLCESGWIRPTSSGRIVKQSRISSGTSIESSATSDQSHAGGDSNGMLYFGDLNVSRICCDTGLWPNA